MKKVKNYAPSLLLLENSNIKDYLWGASCSSDIAQEIMEKVLFGLEEVETFIDDIGIFSDNWESHLKSINVVLKNLKMQVSQSIL